jgi:hypothetical protein
MREVVTVAGLQREIANSVEDKLRNKSTFDMSVFWFPVPSRCERVGDGPNWRLDLDPNKVPAALVAVWDSIRSEFEDRYDIAES